MQPLTGATRANITLSLGMMSMIVSVHAAVEDKGPGLHNCCGTGHALARVKQNFTCPECGSADSATFVKAKQVGADLVEIPPETLAESKAAAETFKKSIELTIHPADQVSAVLVPSGKSYYLNMKDPKENAWRSYTLLARLVQSRPDMAFMAKYTLSSVASIFQLVVAGEETLVLRQMADADLVREHPVITVIEPDDKQMALATQIVDLQAEPFIELTHGTGKTSIIAEYALANARAAAEAPAAGGTVTDITDLLTAMLAAKAPAEKAKRAPRARAPRKAS